MQPSDSVGHEFLSEVRVVKIGDPATAYQIFAAEFSDYGEPPRSVTVTCEQLISFDKFRLACVSQVGIMPPGRLRKRWEDDLGEEDEACDWENYRSLVQQILNLAVPEQKSM